MKLKIQSAFIGALGVAAGLLLGTVDIHAQDAPPPGGTFDPSQMRQRMLERIRDRMEVAQDSDWTLISGSIQKVMDARRDLMGLGGQGGPPFGPGPGGPPPIGRRDANGGPPGPSRNFSDETAGPGGAGGPPPFAGPPGRFRPSNPEMEALRKAIEQKASATELRAKIARVKVARDQKQAALQKAQEDLRQILSVRQEAVAVTMGLL